MAVDARCWEFLPSELRLMILDSLVEEGESLSRYTSVCREWQHALEKHIYRRLKITPSRIAELGNMIPRRQQYVHYIWLCIEVQTYSCSRCEIGLHVDGDAGFRYRYSFSTRLVNQALRYFIEILSPWKPHGELLLDISIHSASDDAHHFKYLRTDADAIQEPREELLLQITQYHDLLHGWLAGRQVSLPTVDSLERIFESVRPSLDESGGRLPKAPAVTGLLVRRQTRRRMGKLLLPRLLELLPMLKEFHYEPWREWVELKRQVRDEHSHYLFALPFFQRLKRVVIFEDFRQSYVDAYQARNSNLHLKRDRNPSPALGAALAKATAASPCLEHFSASFMIDASHFLPTQQSTLLWKYLESLVLTSLQLSSVKSQADISVLLQTAATAAERMPKLKSMEIWNGDKDLACVFRFRIHAQPLSSPTASITWRSNWNFTLHADVVGSWETVARSRTGRSLRVYHEFLDPSIDIKSHGDAIHHLQFLQPVLRPVSLWQIRREHELSMQTT